MPAASGCSIIAGKIVTMSKVGILATSPRLSLNVQLQQTVRRRHDYPLRNRIDRGADLVNERHQHLAPFAADHETTASDRTLNVFHNANRLARRRLDAEADQ